jgi:hypothetical protein
VVPEQDLRFNTRVDRLRASDDYYSPWAHGKHVLGNVGGVWFEESLHLKCSGASWVYSSNLVG